MGRVEKLAILLANKLGRFSGDHSRSKPVGSFFTELDNRAPPEAKGKAYNEKVS